MTTSVKREVQSRAYIESALDTSFEALGGIINGVEQVLHSGHAITESASRRQVWSPRIHTVALINCLSEIEVVVLCDWFEPGDDGVVLKRVGNDIARAFGSDVSNQVERILDSDRARSG